MEGFLIYRKEDAARNSHYITMYEEKGKKMGVRVLLRYFEHFSFGAKKGRPTLFYQGEPIEQKPDFLIVRADVPLFSKRLESLGFLVFNNAYLSQIANDKEKTLCLAKAHNIPVPETCFATKKTAIELARKLSFPLVIKPLDGHGGADGYRYGAVERRAGEYVHHAVCHEFPGIYPFVHALRGGGSGHQAGIEFRLGGAGGGSYAMLRGLDRGGAGILDRRAADMTWLDYVLIGAVLLAVVAAARIFFKKGSGCHGSCGSCGGNCGSCPHKCK